VLGQPKDFATISVAAGRWAIPSTALSLLALALCLPAPAALNPFHSPRRGHFEHRALAQQVSQVA
jgi:hypothetical protein